MVAAPGPTIPTSHRDLFENITTNHWQSVWKFVMKMTSDRHVTDDLCQETFIRAFETLESLNDSEKLKSWLFSISYHVTIDWMRKRSADRRLRLRLEVAESEDGYWNSPLHCVIRGEEIEKARKDVADLWRCVNTLPPIYREVVILRYRDKLPLAIIAARTDSPVANVKVRLHRARKLLRRRVHNGGGLSAFSIDAVG